jgi:cysteine desulfurase
MSPIYLDNNATTHLDPVVAQRMYALHLEGISNPASQHRQGRQALHLLEEAKSQILELLAAPRVGMESARIVLTSGGTEANNLVIYGLLATRPGIAIVGGTDHPSVIEAARLYSKKPDQCRVLPARNDGRFDIEQLETWLDEIYSSPSGQVSLVSIMLGNNETGVLQDLKNMCAVCDKYQVPVHSDIVQAVGKIPFDMSDIGLAAVTLTAHKIHGPVGIGALVLDHSLSIEPLIVGGGQQLGMRAGTEPVIPAVGLALALRQICEAREAGVFHQVARMRDHFEQTIAAMVDVRVIGQAAPRLPHTSNLSFVGLDRQALHMALDLNGLACSTGSACSSGSSRPSGSLVAMGLPNEVILGSLRFSFSRFTTDEDVSRALEIIANVLDNCRLTA